jgi:hypothetical protein
MSPYRIQVRVGDEWHELDAGPIRAEELKSALGMDPSRRLRLDEPGGPRLLDDDEILELFAGMAFSSVEWLRYRRSLKHKREPSHGVKGSICPDDVDTDRAQELLEASVPGPGRKRWATDGERFFAAHPDNAGGWHGWPEPVERVPVPILRRWRADGTLT